MPKSDQKLNVVPATSYRTNTLHHTPTEIRRDRSDSLHAYAAEAAYYRLRGTSSGRDICCTVKSKHKRNSSIRDSRPQVASGLGSVVLSRHAEEIEASCVNALTQNTLCQGQLKTVALKNTESHEKESKSRPQCVHVSERVDGARFDHNTFTNHDITIKNHASLR